MVKMEVVFGFGSPQRIPDCLSVSRWTTVYGLNMVCCVTVHVSATIREESAEGTATVAKEFRRAIEQRLTLPLLLSQRLLS